MYFVKREPGFRLPRDRASHPNFYVHTLVDKTSGTVLFEYPC